MLSSKVAIDQAITAAWQAHQRGQASFGYRLWSVLMFQAWLQQHEGAD